MIDVEEFARALHNSMREVSALLTAFEEWEATSEEIREGRRVMARAILGRHVVRTRMLADGPHPDVEPNSCTNFLHGHAPGCACHRDGWGCVPGCPHID